VCVRVCVCRRKKERKKKKVSDRTLRTPTSNNNKRERTSGLGIVSTVCSVFLKSEGKDCNVPVRMSKMSESLTYVLQKYQTHTHTHTRERERERERVIVLFLPSRDKARLLVHVRNLLKFDFVNFETAARFRVPLL
jgi:hypothetical protein